MLTFLFLLAVMLVDFQKDQALVIELTFLFLLVVMLVDFQKDQAFVVFYCLVLLLVWTLTLYQHSIHRRVCGSSSTSHPDVHVNKRYFGRYQFFKHHNMG